MSARELAARTDADAVATLVTDEIARSVFPDRLDDPAFLATLDRSTRENVRAIVAMFEGRLEAHETQPPGALAFADMSAELGIPVSVVERAYWVGVARFWREWFDIAVHAAAKGGAGSLPELVREPTMELFAYIDHVLESVVSRYDAARADMIRTRAHLRRVVLSQILSGAAGEEGAELDDALGYRVRATHLAMLVELPSDTGRVETAVSGFAQAAGATGTLLLQQGARTWAVWLGRPGPFGARDLAALRDALATSGARIAVGDPASGLAGLRRTHEQAVSLARVQRALDGSLGAVLWHGDVRLEALLLADPPSARRFVDEELGPLAEGSARCRRIREALLAWLSSGSQAGAAAVLGVHENTIRARIRQAEDLLPGALASRRTELQVALRLERVLGAQGRAENSSGPVVPTPQ